MPKNTCYTSDAIYELGGAIIENSDGSVSVFVSNGMSDSLIPYSLTKPCCEVLNSKYIFDIDKQKCLWSVIPKTDLGCSLDDKFNIVLNPNGNDGTIFYVDSEQNCTLSVDFDYLFNIKCETLLNILFPEINTTVCDGLLEAFETFDVSMTLDVVDGTSLTSVYENNFFPSIGVGKLYTYISNHSGTTGFYVSGKLLDTTIDNNYHPLILNNDADLNCGVVNDSLIDRLWTESNLSGNSLGSSIFESNIHSDSFNSNWLHFHADITDPLIIDKIINEKIKISLKINHACSDFCILLDNITLNKNCSTINGNNIYVSKSPGFELDRIRDNKKSWVSNTDLEHRQFNISKENNTYPIRSTDYFVNDERLVINTKEIDLDISLASAVETDVWCYIVDNSCILTGCSSADTCCTTTRGCSTGTTCCGDNKIDFNYLLTQPLSAVTTIEDFEYFLTSELIDVKNRQTLSGYPTLRALYDRYMSSSLYCSTNSSKFNYLTMEQFAGLVGDYWVDIVEQVIPATTIWGSTKIYSNTIFDQQKYKYKAYTLQLCGNPFSGETVLSPINGVNGICASVDVKSTTIPLKGGPKIGIITYTCSTVCIAQMNSGSEFIGKVYLGNDVEDDGGGYITENTIGLSINTTNTCDLSSSLGSLTATVSGGTAPYTYLWSNGSTSAIINNLTSGTYSVTVTDSLGKTKTISYVYAITLCDQKNFQDGSDFDFMDGDEYEFM